MSSKQPEHNAATWPYRQPVATEDFAFLQEEFVTGLEDARTYVRFECPGVRLEFSEAGV